MWLADPVTREPLPAFVAHERRLAPLLGPIVWLDEHAPNHPGWQVSEPDALGFERIRRCRRPCCDRSALLARLAAELRAILETWRRYS